MMWNTVHERTLRWVLASSQANKPWVVTNDEQGPAGLGVPPDPGYSGFAGKDAKGLDVGYTLHDIRKHSLWGNLMAGGAGVETPGASETPWSIAAAPQSAVAGVPSRWTSGPRQFQVAASASTCP